MIAPLRVGHRRIIWVLLIVLMAGGAVIVMSHAAPTPIEHLPAALEEHRGQGRNR